jgi:hypothetical protein
LHYPTKGGKNYVVKGIRSAFTAKETPPAGLAHPSATALAAQLLADGTSVLLPARGHSMLPFVREGDILTIEAMNNASPQLDDIVFYRSPHGSPMVHRVTAIRHDLEADFILIRGDASTGVPDCVEPRHVLGRVVALTRNGQTLGANSLHRRIAARLWRGLFPLRWLLNRLRPTVLPA